MTLLRTYRPTRSRNRELGFNSNSDLFNRFFNEEKHDCNQFFAVPPANIVESKEGYSINIAAPGFEKSDFNIELNENLLTISLKKEDQNNDQKEDQNKFVMREFNFNKFSRSFKISDKIDKEKIEAAYHNGVLEINLPLKEEVLKNTNRSIEIE
ncbi:MAG: Hsp20/alpha crystallin family protein [Bacteroidota bacterium]